MNPISAASYDIVFNANGYERLNQFLTTANYSKIFVFVDENTHEHCLPAFLGELSVETPLDIIEFLRVRLIKRLTPVYRYGKH